MKQAGHQSKHEVVWAQTGMALCVCVRARPECSPHVAPPSHARGFQGAGRRSLAVRTPAAAAALLGTRARRRHTVTAASTETEGLTSDTPQVSPRASGFGMPEL
jgi:hypothetical protein